MNELISKTALLSRIDAERKHLLELKMDGAEHIIVHYARRIIEDMPSASSVDCIDRQKTIAEIQYKYYDNAIGIDIVDMIAHMPSVTPKARWIPVSEEPKEAGSYITTIKYGDKYAVGQRYYHGKYVGWEDSCVIAYMPLPQPYAESEDEG